MWPMHVLQSCGPCLVMLVAIALLLLSASLPTSECAAMQQLAAVAISLAVPLCINQCTRVNATALPLPLA